MEKTVTLALGAILLATCVPALAGSADSTGGIKVKSDDGRFEGTLGGLINYDYETFQKDMAQAGYGEGPFVRRAELALGGKAFDFRYKLATDLKGSTPETKDLWIGTDVLAGFVKAGHMRPAFGMEQLTPTSDIVFTERPYVGNNGILGGREFQNGISYDTHAVEGLTAMVMAYSANAAAEKSASTAQATTANGHGFSARATWAPVMTDGATLHLGVAYDDVAWKTDAGANAPAIGAPIVAKNAPALALVAAGTYDAQKTPAAELAGRLGPFFAQAEYARARYAALAGPDQDVTTGYAETSVFVTGETKPYKADKGTFGTPKPANVALGAIELKARYDVIRNDAAAGQPKASQATFGANYYFNTNVRVMAEYVLGRAELAGAEDKPKALVLRGQIAF